MGTEEEEKYLAQFHRPPLLKKVTLVEFEKSLVHSVMWALMGWEAP